MKKTLLTLALALVQIVTFAQAPAIQWQKSFGGTEYEEGYDIKPTSDGGYIIVGFAYSINGDVSGNHKQYYDDVWIVKISKTGILQWQKALGGTSFDEGYSIQQTTDGGYIMAGYTVSTDGDVSGNHGIQDAWIVKLSSTGTLEWQKTLGGSGNDYGESILQTTDGGYIMAGYTSSTDGDVSGNDGHQDAWIVKLSSTGVLEWQKTYGGTSPEEVYSINPTADGGYIMAGYTESTNGDVTVNHGDKDAWIVKLSSTGELQWQKSLGGTYYDYAKNIQQTIDGGYIMAGYSYSKDGDILGNHGNDDAWIVKLSSTGELQWQKALGGTGDDYANSIQQTTDGGFVIAGYTSSKNGDVSGLHGGGYDAWIVKLSSTGVIQWQKALGGTGYDNANSIQKTVDGGYIVAGFTFSTDGDALGNDGYKDIWVVKLAPEVLANTGFENNNMTVYPNPAKNQINLQFPNQVSVDKIVITDLTGKVILTQTTNTTQVNLSPLSNGMYILEAFSGEEKYSSKFIKE